MKDQLTRNMEYLVDECQDDLAYETTSHELASLLISQKEGDINLASQINSNFIKHLFKYDMEKNRGKHFNVELLSSELTGKLNKDRDIKRSNKETKATSIVSQQLSATKPINRSKDSKNIQGLDNSSTAC